MSDVCEKDNHNYADKHSNEMRNNDYIVIIMICPVGISFK